MPSSWCCQGSSSYPPKQEKKGEERSAEASQWTPPTPTPHPQTGGGQEHLQLLICKEKEELVSFFGGTLEFQRKLHPVHTPIKGKHGGC